MTAFTFASIFVIIALLAMFIMYFGGLWYSHLIYKIQMKELNKRYWYHKMQLNETAHFVRQTRFLK